MAGEIIHIELPSSDFARSATFYGKLFGWKADGQQSGGHLLFELPGGVQGSWIRTALAQATGPVPFVAVADVDKALAEAEKLGGRVIVKRMALANRGTFGLLADCDGNVVGVLAAKAGAGAGAGAAAATGTAAAAPGTGTAAGTREPGKAANPKPSPKATAKTAAKPAASAARSPSAKTPARKR